MTPFWAIGLMTGTVLDGNVDIAMIKTDGETIAEFGPWMLARYPEAVNALIAEAVGAAQEWQFNGPEPAVFAKAEAALTRAQADAVTAFLTANLIEPAQIDVIGLHGQTVLHRAPSETAIGATRQLGDGAMMAEQLGIETIYDFRSADVAAGGQGAPLAAIYHTALLRLAKSDAPAALLNLGGVGNLTWWGGADHIIAFDTGPANGPINDWVKRHTGQAMDTGGALAAKGQVDEGRLTELLQHPYLTAPAPKSLDRYDFTADMANGLSLEDGAAMLTAFAAECVNKALDQLPARPKELIVCGGGRRNPQLLQQIARRCRLSAMPAEMRGWRGDAIEAECFAYLAARAKRGLAYSFPTTTGVKTAMTGGKHARAPLSVSGKTKPPGQVITKVAGKAGLIRLNRPQAMNAIDHSMLSEIDLFLNACAANYKVNLVIIDAAGGRSFSAGGDIQNIYHRAKNGDLENVRQFWRDEYPVNAKIAYYPKPYVAFINGVCMGGGAGVSCQGSHRIVGEKAMIAMPECSIGLIPDVGISKILATAGPLGRFLAMCGYPMTAADAIAAGFADTFVPADQFTALKIKIIETGDVNIINEFAADPGPSPLVEKFATIASAFEHTSPLEIETHLANMSGEFAEEALRRLRKAAPLSAFASLQVIEAVRADPRVEYALQLEYRFTHRSIEQGELLEGVRAAVIDKDRSPKWRHGSLSAVTAEEVAEMTAELGAVELDI